MSRRKQAKPRALKREVLDAESTEDTLSISDNFCATFVESCSKAASDSGEDSTSSELDDINKYRCGECQCSFEDLNEFLEHHEDCVTRSSNGGIGGTATPPGSIRSLSCTPDDTMSDTPGSSSCCPTPSSSSGGGGNSAGFGDPDTELSYTLGVTENTPYGCQFCDKAFPRLSYLKRHEQVHSDQMPFRCEYCHRLFKHKRSRDRHVKLHTGDRKYRCTQCESAFSRSDHLKIHMKTHDNGKPYQCTVCNRGYNTAAALSSHMQNHKKVLNNLDVRNSLTLEPGKTLDTGTFNDLHHVTNRRSESPEGPKPLVCSFCPQVCSSPGALRDHIGQNHAMSSPSIPASRCLKCCEDRLSPSAICTHKLEPRSPGDKSPQRPDRSSPAHPLTCGFCSRSDFPTIESLQLHVQVLHMPTYQNASSAKSLKQRHKQHIASSPCGSSDLVCDLCGQSFSSLSCLQKHNLTAHSLADIFSKNRPSDIYCSQCNICFSSSSALLEHVHLIHESNHNSNSNKRSISSSRVRHNGAKQLKSSLGLRNSPLALFNGASPFYKRQGVDGVDFVSSRQTPTPPKALSNTLLCNQCNAAFQDFESFRTHLKNHLDEAAGIGTASTQRFSCPECDLEFDNERILDCHVIGHFLSSSTEYGCQSCLKLFQKPDDLQKHLLDIHAQHLYRCTLCKQLFDSKVSIQVHFAVKHSNECRSFKCISCGAYFRTELEFQVHVKVSHLSTCHSDSKANQPFRCLLCDQVCSGEAQLRFHVASHKKPFACTLCSEAFHVEFLLDRHVQAVHQQNVTSSPTGHHPFLSLQQQQQRNAQISTQDNCVDGSTGDVAQNLTMKRTNSNVSVKVETLRNSPPESVTPSTATSTPCTTSNSMVSQSTLEHRCEVCESSFATESNLNSHRRQMHNVKVHKKANISSGSSSSALSLFCAYCNESCKSRHDLENHMKSHTGTPTRHKCNICDEVCPSAATLAEHKLTHCKVVSSSTCIVCRLPLTAEEDFVSHLQQHNGPSGLPGPCVVCRQTLVAEVEVQMHAKFHAKHSSSNPHETPSLATHGVCCVCSRQFEIGNLIIRALTKPSSSDVLPHTYMCKDCFHSKTDGHLNAMRCIECGVKFETESDLDSHRRCVHNHRGTSNGKTYQCIKCQSTFESETEIQAHVTCHVIQEGTDHECKLCRKVLDSPSKLQCHLIEHTFEGCPSFTCYMCSSVFTGAHLLQQHMLEHGLDARPYDCSRCHHKFYFRAELENHSYVHQREYQMYQPSADGINEVTPMNLSEDPKTFLANCQPYNLLGHYHPLKNLQQDGRLLCKKCNQDFASYNDLQQHSCFPYNEKSESPVAGRDEKSSPVYSKFELGRVATTREKKHQCQYCPKRFTRRENMRIHMRTHHHAEATADETLRPCPHCGKTFTKKTSLKEHIRTHTSTTYPCEICNELFASNELLQEHLSATHESKPNHKCTICGEVFEDAEALKSHIQNIHPSPEASNGKPQSPKSSLEDSREVEVNGDETPLPDVDVDAEQEQDGTDDGDNNDTAQEKEDQLDNAQMMAEVAA